MDKITKVNVEGDEYGFVAGQTVKGVSGALASDYVKHVILPEGAEVVEGMLIAVTFVNDNTAGYSGEKTVWSTDGINFYWDSGYTQLITLPPQGCYTVTATETQYEYKLSEYPVLVMGDMTKPFCDSRGHPAGGKLWQAGDTVTVINLENRFIALQTTVNEIIQGSSLPVTSGAVYEKCKSLEPVDEVTSGNQHSVSSNAVAVSIKNNTYADVYKLITGNLGKTYLIGHTYDNNSWQAFTLFEFFGGRADGTYGKCLLGLYSKNAIMSKRIFNMNNIPIQVTLKDNELFVYAVLASYCYFTVNILWESKFIVDMHEVSSIEGTIVWNNNWND